MGNQFRNKKKQAKLIKEDFELENGAKSVPFKRKLFKYTDGQFFYLALGDVICRIGVQKVAGSYAHFFVEATSEISLSGASEGSDEQVVKLKEKLKMREIEISSLEAEIEALESGQEERLTSMKDYLKFAHDRLLNKYGENFSVDYLKRMRELIK